MSPPTGRPQVRVDVERLAQADQPLLGTDGTAVPLRPADRAEQHRVGAAARGERLGRQRRLPTSSIAAPPNGCP